jgi:hypothetical protein
MVALGLVLLATPLFAGDIVLMPTGNTVAPGNVELNVIYQTLPPANMEGDMAVGEAFVGLFDRLELDVDYINTRGDDTSDFTEVNAYLTLIKEAPNHPSLIAGCTNVFGSDWLGGDDPSWFVLGAMNLQAPAELNWYEPLVRLHLGYGAKFHRDRPFGGLQLKFTPRFGAAVLNYQSDWKFMGTYTFGQSLEGTIGWNDGMPFYRVGGFLSW